MSMQKFVAPEELEILYPAHIRELKKRHDKALERAGAAHAIIFSGAPRGVFLDDYDYPFKANPHFVSWLPLLSTPHCYLIYSPGNTPILVFFQEKDYWHVPPAQPQGYWPAEFDVRVVHTRDDIAQHLPDNRDSCILIGDVHDESHAFGIERVNPATAMHVLHYARGVKTGYELECMRAASRRGARGHMAAADAFRAGKSEFDIHLDYCRAVAHTDNELPYGNIIALNENAAVLHYQHQAHEVPDVVRSFLIDAGARVQGYASDITRTYAKNDGEFADLIATFDELQQELVAEVRTGVDFRAVHRMCHRKVGELMLQAELATGSVDALIETGVTAAFYPHGLGHLLGIQVHDVGGHAADDAGNVIEPPEEHPFLRLTRTLEADQVLTIEPGIYVIDMLLDSLAGTPGHALIDQDRVAWLRPYGGIRIEDNVRVLDGGIENLTRDAMTAISA